MWRAALSCSIGGIVLASVSACSTFASSYGSGGYGELTRRLASDQSEVFFEAGVPRGPHRAAAAVGSVAKLAVAEAGLQAAAPEVVQALEQGAGLRDVIVVSGGGGGSGRASSSRFGTRRTRESADGSLQLARLTAERDVPMFLADLHTARENARRAGCDHLLLLAITARAEHEGPVFWPIDFLILPMFFLPDQRVGGDGRALAWLIDVRSGEVLRLETAQHENWRLATFMTLQHGSDLLVRSGKVELVRQLGQRLARPGVAESGR